MQDRHIDAQAKLLIRKIMQQVREGGLPWRDTSKVQGDTRTDVAPPMDRNYRPQKKIVQHGRPTYGNAPKSFKPSPQPFKPV